MKKFIFLFFLTVLLSCKNSNNNLGYESFISEGKAKNDVLTFCSTVAQEIEYNYRIGVWTFKSSHGYKIAQGEYNISDEVVEGHDGCPYKYRKNSINLENWKFWNEKGELIEPNQKLINLIQPIQFKTDDPFQNNY
ncbi:hypothetical protein [Winogradskyella sp.]|uniref:hypothetical protein n=1 Tax=Winogradskyella sp. TaxID=1883156 RepID=UPI003BA9E112